MQDPVGGEMSCGRIFRRRIFLGLKFLLPNNLVHTYYVLPPTYPDPTHYCGTARERERQSRWWVAEHGSRHTLKIQTDITRTLHAFDWMANENPIRPWSYKGIDIEWRRCWLLKTAIFCHGLQNIYPKNHLLFRIFLGDTVWYSQRIIDILILFLFKDMALPW